MEILATSRVQAAIDLIWQEATLLDNKDYFSWLRMWDDEGFYVVPIDPATTDFAGSLNYVFDDSVMRKKRVGRMSSGLSASATTAANTVRTVSRFTVIKNEGNVLALGSAQILAAYKGGTTTIFAANLEHHIDFGSSTPKIRQKVVRLVNSSGPLSAIGFLL